MRKAVFTVRPVWVTNGRRSAVITMRGSSLRMLQFRLGMNWLCRSTKQGCLSFAPTRIRVGPNSCFSTAAAAAALLVLLGVYFLFERSESLIATCEKKEFVCVYVRQIAKTRYTFACLHT